MGAFHLEEVSPISADTSSKSVCDHLLHSISSAGAFFSDLHSQAQNTFNEPCLNGSISNQFKALCHEMVNF